MVKVLPRYSHKCQDEKIFPDRYYCWYYKPDLTINLAPISWDTRKLAKLVLGKTFENRPDILESIHIIKGSKAIKRGYTLGIKYIRGYDGSLFLIKKFYIPPEWNKDKHSRRHFMLRIYRKKLWEDGIKKYYRLIYGR